MWKQALATSGSLAALLIAFPAAAQMADEEPAAASEAQPGHQPAEVYPDPVGEDNPDLTGERGNGIDPVPAEEGAMEEGDVKDVEAIYPENVEDGNPQIVDPPNQEPPRSEGAEVHGDFAEDNPELQE